MFFILNFFFLFSPPPPLISYKRMTQDSFDSLIFIVVLTYKHKSITRTKTTIQTAQWNTTRKNYNYTLVCARSVYLKQQPCLLLIINTLYCNHSSPGAQRGYRAPPLILPEMLIFWNIKICSFQSCIVPKNILGWTFHLKGVFQGGQNTKNTPDFHKNYP